MGKPEVACWSARGRPALWDLCWEEELLESASRGNPGLFTYVWEKPVLILGYAQREVGGIDLGFCGDRGIPVLRRCTGGSGVLHQGDLSIGLALPTSHPWTRGIRELYEGLLHAVLETLATFGVSLERPEPVAGPAAKPSHICFEDRGTETLLFGGRKVLGCAQVRRRSCAFVHGTLLFHMDPELQARVFKVSAERIEASLGALPERPGLDPDALAARLGETLARLMGIAIGPPTAPPAPPEDCLRRALDPFWSPVPATGGR